MFESFKNPPVRFRLSPTWVWNGTSDLAQIEAQMKDMQEKGIGSISILNSASRQPSSEALECVKKAAVMLGMGITSYTTAHSKRYETDKKPELSLLALKRSIDSQVLDSARITDCGTCYYTTCDETGILPCSFRHSPQWPHFRLVAEYAARLQYIMSLGWLCAQVAIVRPEYHRCDDIVEAYATALRNEHIDFDVVNESALQNAIEFNGQVLISKTEYELLLVPAANDLHPTTVERLRELLDCGAKLASDIQLPVELRKALSNMIQPYVSIRFHGSECQDIAFLHKKSDEWDVFFFVNISQETREVQMSIRCDGAPHELHLDNGKITALPDCTQVGSRTVLLRRFEPYSSLLICFSREPDFSVSPEMPESGKQITLDDQWEFRISSHNCVSIPAWAVRTPEQTGFQHISLYGRFTALFHPESLYLLVPRSLTEEVSSESCIISVNGNNNITATPWSNDPGFNLLDISKVTTEGMNEIAVTSRMDGCDIAVIRNMLNNVRILGSFSVEESLPILLPPRRRSYLQSWTKSGYPQYSGTAIYAQTVTLPSFSRSQRVILSVTGTQDVIEYVINEASAAVRAWPPYTVDITPLVKPGANRIELRVTNTMANFASTEPQLSGIQGNVALYIA